MKSYIALFALFALFFIISSKCKNEDGNIFKEEEEATEIS